MLAPLILKNKAEKRLKGGHPWIFSNEIDSTQTPLKSFEAGQQVQVLQSNGRSLGVAYINPNTLIAARMISRRQDTLTAKLVQHRLQAALSLREQAFPEPYYRLVYGDSDFLPGLVIDRYGDVFVVQISTAGMEAVKPLVTQAIQSLFSPKGILFRNNGKYRETEGLSGEDDWEGIIPDVLELRENAVTFRAPLQSGQKTGWFYDHRINRQRAAQLTNGKRVLDVFSYVGGWGVQMAHAGATELFAIDASETALDFVYDNVQVNQLPTPVTTICGDAFIMMKELKDANEKFDMVIIDPPAFIARRKDQKNGEAAYLRANQLALSLVQDGGVLISGSCSMHLDRQRHMDLLRITARQADRPLQILEQGGLGADHPVHPAVPETDYLKSIIARAFPR